MVLLSDSGLVYRARWTVRGEPRVPWKAEGHFDGISEFKLDRHGKIYQHKVDNTILNDPPYLKLPILGEAPASLCESAAGCLGIAEMFAFAKQHLLLLLLMLRWLHSL